MTLSEEEAISLGISVKKNSCGGGSGGCDDYCLCSVHVRTDWLVGLLIPHICRMLFGSNNQRVIPASMGLGAIFMLVIDTAARCMLSAEIPVSILTAIIGAPFFIILLRRTGGIVQ